MKWNPTSRGVGAMAAVALLCCFGYTRAATFDAYLEIEGVPGESSDTAHARWIEAGAFHWGAAGPTANAASQLSNLSVLKSVDAASPLLHAACASRKLFPKAKLELVRIEPTRARFYRIILEEVLVTHSQVTGSIATPSGALQEDLGLSFGRVSWTYTEFAADGIRRDALASYWDAVRGTGGANVLPTLRVSAAPSPAGGGMILRFPAEAGVSYRILGSDDPVGSYILVQNFTAAVTGDASLTLPAPGARQFFRVEELP